MGCSLSLTTLALPVKDNERINSIQLSNTLPANANKTELDQSYVSSISSKLESTTEAAQHKDKSTTKATPTNSNSLTAKNSLNDIPKNSTTDAEPSPNGIGTRLSGSLLKILVQMGK